MGNNVVNKIKIAVLAGGPSFEHEVSLKSAENVIKYLDATKFEILHIKISKNGIWVDQTSNKEFTENDGINYLKKSGVDLVFIVLHGEYGEDGTIQKLLEVEDIKFTGSKSTSSSLAMDKVLSSKILTDAHLKVPSFVSIGKKEWGRDSEKFIQDVFAKFSLPIVVKPTDRGSSVGISIVKKESEVKPAIMGAFKFSDNVMVQDFIVGKELTCAVIEDKDGKLIPLIPTEIIPNSSHEFFDYTAKYVAGVSVEITPPNLPAKIIKEVQDAAIKAHKSLGCSHVSRTDFILDGNVLYTLEVNTIPGMTETSLVPQGAQAKGINFPLLLEIIIESALK